MWNLVECNGKCYICTPAFLHSKNELCMSVSTCAPHLHARRLAGQTALIDCDSVKAIRQREPSYLNIKFVHFNKQIIYYAICIILRIFGVCLVEKIKAAMKNAKFRNHIL